MAMSRNLSLLLYVTLMLIALTANQAYCQSSQPQTQSGHSLYGASQGSLHPQECGPRCTMRCSATAYKKPCLFFCNKCCDKCLCVPPGTYGNKQLCPCYNNWKTKRGGPKCP
ncbi:protein GAST1-like [Chenopodium quinoa]|uniref:Uncharacterized protein n=1 Tax=Chenopodium quinoa TaxID=63459 RepID=A0A803KMB4_CHEQI|nr:protein GAST1-like [Chenopodium quinoa]